MKDRFSLILLLRGRGFLCSFLGTLSRRLCMPRKYWKDKINKSCRRNLLFNWSFQRDLTTLEAWQIHNMESSLSDSLTKRTSRAQATWPWQWAKNTTRLIQELCQTLFGNSKWLSRTPKYTQTMNFLKPEPTLRDYLKWVTRSL